MKEYIVRGLVIVLVVTTIGFFALQLILTTDEINRSREQGWNGTINSCITLINPDDMATPEIQTAVAQLAQRPNCKEDADAIYATATAKARIPAWWPWGH